MKYLIRDSRWWWVLFLVFFLTVGAIVFFTPFVWMIFGIFKTSGELTSSSPSLLPKVWSLKNFSRLFERAPYGTFYLNSLIVSTAATFGALVTSSVAGYIFAKKRFYGKEILFLGILSTMMIPFSVTMVPLYILMVNLGLANTLTAVILPYVAHPFGVYLMRRHIETIPNALVEAAIVDGASEFWIYYRVILPLSKSSLAALAIFMFMFNWNNYLWPLVVLQETIKMTLSVGIASLQWDAWTSYDLSVTAGALAIIPVLIVFAFAQRYIVQGLTLSGLKG